jgi:hypothetical protein
MTPDERLQKIEAYGNAYDYLVEALTQFPKELWQYRPAPDDWSIHELIIHIADSEANSFIRCRRAVAEPGSAALGYDEAQWARALNYHAQSTDDALLLFKWLRGNTYSLIKMLPEAAWSQTIVHSENGVMTLDDWLTVYTAHVPEHVEQMQRNYEAWLAANGR